MTGARQLPDKTGPPWATVQAATSDDLAEVRQFIGGLAAAAGLGEERAGWLVIAVNEIVSNAITHGVPPATINVTAGSGGVAVAVHDQGVGFTPPGSVSPNFGGGPAPVYPPRPAPDRLHGRGLWLAAQMCDRLDVQTTPTGTTVTVHMTA